MNVNLLDAPVQTYIYADGQSVPYTLKQADRADCCGVRAVCKVELYSGGELYFCNHHFQENLVGLMAVSEKIIDESKSLHNKN